MKKLLTTTLLIGAISLSGCSTLKDSMLTGGGAGMVAGGLIGNADGTGRGRKKNTMKGAMIGAVIGAGISYLAHGEKKKKDIKKQHKELVQKNDIPLITKPKIKRIWVGDKINGKRFIKGHWEYIIEENSTWSKK